MIKRVLNIVLVVGVVAYSFITWWNIHQTRMVLEPILKQMLAECAAGATADYCNPQHGANR